MLEDYQKELEKRGIRARVLVEEGDAREKLCEVVAREQPDVMVMGHRRSAINIGSVALHCIEHAPTSVYIVRV